MLRPKGGAIPLFSSPLVMWGDLCLLSVSICDLPSGSLVAGGDMHYHLSQHGVFSEKEMRFYASEIILGLEHMHTCFVVYRDLKVRSAIPVVMAIATLRCWVQVDQGVPKALWEPLSLQQGPLLVFLALSQPWQSGSLCDHLKGGTCGQHCHSNQSAY